LINPPFRFSIFDFRSRTINNKVRKIVKMLVGPELILI
jgi:hypothetical protein